MITSLIASNTWLTPHAARRSFDMRRGRCKWSHGQRAQPPHGCGAANVFKRQRNALGLGIATMAGCARTLTERQRGAPVRCRPVNAIVLILARMQRRHIGRKCRRHMPENARTPDRTDKRRLERFQACRRQWPHHRPQPWPRSPVPSDKVIGPCIHIRSPLANRRSDNKRETGAAFHATQENERNLQQDQPGIHWFALNGARNDIANRLYAPGFPAMSTLTSEKPENWSLSRVIDLTIWSSQRFW